MKPERIASFLIGIAILAYLFSMIDFEKTKAALISLNPLYMLFFFMALAFVVFLKGLKWKLSLGIFRISTDLAKAIEIWVIGFSIGAITPGRVGDFVKIAYLEEKKSKSFGAVILDRMTDIFAVVFFALFGLNVFGSAIGATKEVVAFSVLALIFGALIIRRHYKSALRIMFRQLVPEKYKAYFKSNAVDFLDSLKQAGRQKKRILIVVLMSLFTWMITGMQGIIIARALEIDIAYFNLLFIMSIVALVELIPVTVAGLGTREATIVFLMSFLGIETEKAIVFSLINFVFGYVMLAFVGYLLWMRNPVKLNFSKQI